MKDAQGQYLCPCEGQEHDRDCLYYESIEELKRQLAEAKDEDANLWDRRAEAQEKARAADRAWVAASNRVREIETQIGERLAAGRAA